MSLAGISYVDMVMVPVTGPATESTSEGVTVAVFTASSAAVLIASAIAVAMTVIASDWAWVGVIPRFVNIADSRAVISGAVVTGISLGK